MPPNKQGKDLRQVTVLEERIKGKNFKEIGEVCGTSESTAWRDWKELGEDASIKAGVDELKQKNLANAINASSIEGDYLNHINIQKGEIPHDIVGKITNIKTSGQKIHSSLEGANTDLKGGEKRTLKLEIVNPE